ncbi:Phosphate regulon sensor protein PhoR (SphS) [Serinicoccus hydrothermalis]|uniref:Sensor-like histidine kinase SenX3 n=1 Tax=Serinicoccus hydrothermalis TaxID=1758689 RepID=A0A1B1NF22_9MICO|nr:ATP-binding protein [Serinicoccus hydrothermalis]ANS80003.1 Phosphate regulon sensor protein PhoR (SphS) [Serinicoccus hydrothermalis]
MTPLTSGLLGAALGVLAVLLLWWLRREWRAAGVPVESAPELVVPEGVKEVLSVLRSGAIVVDGSARVHVATGAALAFGLVRGDNLVNARLREMVGQVLGERTVEEAELEIVRGPLSSSQVLLAVRVAPFADGLALILVDDRTQARRVEAVRRDFVVNVSHELKTPVGGLALLAEAVLDAAEDPEAVRRFAGRMKTESERLTRLVAEIVDLSRLQANDLLADMVLVDVAACAAEAVEQTRVVAGERTVVAAPAGRPEELRIYGDRELVTTAIRNLVTNAIAYSEDSTRVGVVTRRVKDVVEVSVSDQGRGISPEDQERIFERFYRVDPARSRRTGGTGLGLSIVKHISAGHGGSVTVWSEEGQGSTFTLRLPAVDDPREPGSPAPHRQGRPARVPDPAHGETAPPTALAGIPRGKVTR